MKTKFALRGCAGAAEMFVVTCMGALAAGQACAEQPPPPCHPNPQASADRNTVRQRGDIRQLPDPLRERLERMAERPNSALPTQAYAEADGPSQLFQYYLLDTNGFEPNPFTARLPGINDKAMLTATGGNCGLPSIGGVRLVVEPKPGLPTDPNDVRAFIDVFTDLSNLFVINNESGWYEGWMIHDLEVPQVAAPLENGRARFGTMTPADAAAMRAMGSYNNVPGHTFTMDGNAPHFPGTSDRFPQRQTNVVPISSAWVRSTACSRPIATVIGNLITRPTGFIHCTSYRTPEAFPVHMKPAILARCRR